MTPETLALIHARAFPSASWDTSTMESFLARPGTVLVECGTFGFALLMVLPPEAEILTICVDPARQGQGHGRTLLDSAISSAAMHGATRLFLEVAEDNTAARGLYRAAGFAPCGRRGGYYARPGGAAVDAVLLDLALPQGQP